MRRNAKDLECTVDRPQEITYYTRYIMGNKKPLFFGSVRVRKAYVSYHLMPIYSDPDLLIDVSDDLKRRMQGKSCFNFTRHDDTLFSELERLTDRCYRRYKANKYI